MSNPNGFVALYDKRFRLYYLGAVCSNNGTWVFRIILSWSAWVMARDPVFTGVIAMLSLMPIAVIGPFLGVLIDRVNLVRAYLLVTIGLMLCPMLFLLLYLGELLSRTGMALLALGFGVVVSAHHPVRQTLGPRLVNRDKISSVVKLSALNFNVGRLVSPAIAGFLIAQFGLTITTLVSIILFVPGLVIAKQIIPRPIDERPVARFVSDLSVGLRVAWSNVSIRISLLLGFFALGSTRGMSEIIAIVTDGKFHQGADGYGLATSSIGFGALAAAVLQIWISEEFLQQTRVRFSLMMLGLIAGMSFALAPQFVFVIIAAPVVGFTGTILAVSIQIAIQANIDDHLRGRVMSLWMMSTVLATSFFAITLSSLSIYIGIEIAVLIGFSLSAALILWLTFVSQNRARFEPMATMRTGDK